MPNSLVTFNRFWLTSQANDTLQPRNNSLACGGNQRRPAPTFVGLRNQCVPPVRIPVPAVLIGALLDAIGGHSWNRRDSGISEYNSTTGHRTKPSISSPGRRQKAHASPWNTASSSADIVPTLEVRRDMGFVPIGIREYLKLHVKANPDENPTDVLARLRGCVCDALAGARCHCGAPIWVVGSASAGHRCFTCITGEAVPSEDYEIDEVLAARGELTE